MTIYIVLLQIEREHYCKKQLVMETTILCVNNHYTVFQTKHFGDGQLLYTYKCFR